jgi:hypothetical protein
MVIDIHSDFKHALPVVAAFSVTQKQNVADPSVLVLSVKECRRAGFALPATLIGKFHVGKVKGLKALNGGSQFRSVFIEYVSYSKPSKIVYVIESYTEKTPRELTADLMLYKLNQGFPFVAIADKSLDLSYCVSYSKPFSSREENRIVMAVNRACSAPIHH